jgi:hypothetical protein
MTATAVDALIEEARRRTRRRRIAGAFAALALLGGGIWAGLDLTSHGVPAPIAPPGFHLVQARGPVEHQLLEGRSLPQPESVDFSSGVARPVRTTTELWFDPEGGLLRIAPRADGRLQSDEVQPCRHPCAPTFAKSYWPVDTKRYVSLGTGTFRGQAVIWLQEHVAGVVGSPRIALDERTHEPIGSRGYFKGKLLSESWVVEHKPDIPARSFWFVVPDLGFGQPVAYSPTADFWATGSNPAVVKARRALGRTPLWLGERFRGHRLQGVTIGSTGVKTEAGDRFNVAPFVIYDYGVVRVEQFGAKHPDGYEQGPLPGRVVVQPTGDLQASTSVSSSGTTHSSRFDIRYELALASRDGVFVQFKSPDAFATLPTGRFPIDRANAVALAKALRPVPSFR